MCELMDVLEPIVHDLKAGHLRRFSNSTFKKEKRHDSSESEAGRNSRSPSSVKSEKVSLFSHQQRAVTGTVDLIR